MPPIVLLTGPPGAGKTTTSLALLRKFDLGFHLPVDDLRQMVVQGLADSVPWTEETEGQFQVAEEAASAVAKVYQSRGFAVVVDHCRNIPRLDQVAETYFAGCDLRKVCLLPSLEVCQRRNIERTNKNFDPAVLIETIDYTFAAFTRDAGGDWLVLDNGSLSPEETAEAILNHTSRGG